MLLDAVLGTALSVEMELGELLGTVEGVLFGLGALNGPALALGPRATRWPSGRFRRYCYRCCPVRTEQQQKIYQGLSSKFTCTGSKTKY